MSPYNTRPSNKTTRPALLILSPRSKAKLLAGGENSKKSRDKQGSATSKIVARQKLTKSEMAQERENLPPPPAVGKMQRHTREISQKMIDSSTEGVLELQSNDSEPETGGNEWLEYVPVAKKLRVPRTVLTDEEVNMSGGDEDVNMSGGDGGLENDERLAGENAKNHNVSKSAKNAKNHNVSKSAEITKRNKPSSHSAVEQTRAKSRPDSPAGISADQHHQTGNSQLELPLGAERYRNRGKRPSSECGGESERSRPPKKPCSAPSSSSFSATMIPRSLSGTFTNWRDRVDSGQKQGQKARAASDSSTIFRAPRTMHETAHEQVAKDAVTNGPLPVISIQDNYEFEENVREECFIGESEQYTNNRQKDSESGKGGIHLDNANGYGEETGLSQSNKQIEGTGSKLTGQEKPSVEDSGIDELGHSLFVVREKPLTTRSTQSRAPVLEKGQLTDNSKGKESHISKTNHPGMMQSESLGNDEQAADDSNESDDSDSEFPPCAQPPRNSNSNNLHGSGKQQRPSNSRAAKGLRRNASKPNISRPGREVQGTVQLQCKKFTYKDLPKGVDDGIFRSHLIPKWIEFISTLPDPWSLGDVLREAQGLFNQSFPLLALQQGHKLARKHEPVYYLLKQRTYEFRSGFATRAEYAVEDFFNSYTWGSSKEGRADYVKWAVPGDTEQVDRDTGAKWILRAQYLPYMWGDVQDPQEEGGEPVLRGPFQHECILNTFAHFLEAINSLPSKNWAMNQGPYYPRVALALATVAVERAFMLWSSGEYDPVDDQGFPVPFSSDWWKDKTDEIMESFDNASPKTWSAIVSGAQKYIGMYRKRAGNLSSKGIVTKYLYGASGRARCFDAEDG